MLLYDKYISLKRPLTNSTTFTCVIIHEYDVCCVAVDDDDVTINVSYDVTKLGQFVGLKRHWAKVRKDRHSAAEMSMDQFVTSVDPLPCLFCRMKSFFATIRNIRVDAIAFRFQCSVAEMHRPDNAITSFQKTTMFFSDSIECGELKLLFNCLLLIVSCYLVWPSTSAMMSTGV